PGLKPTKTISKTALRNNYSNNKKPDYSGFCVLHHSGLASCKRCPKNTYGKFSPNQEQNHEYAYAQNDSVSAGFYSPEYKIDHSGSAEKQYTSGYKIGKRPVDLPRKLHRDQWQTQQHRWQAVNCKISLCCVHHNYCF